MSGKEASHEVSETATAGELLQEACRLFGREELDSALEVDGAVVCTGVVGGVSGGESVGSLGVHSGSRLVLCRSRDRVLAVVAGNFWDHPGEDSLPEWAWDDEVVALAAVAAVCSTAVEFVSERLRNSDSFMRDAVARNGGALEYASVELRADRQLVLAAVANHNKAMTHASEELKADKARLEQDRTQQVDDDDDGQVKDGRKGRKSRDSRAVRIFGDSSLALNQVTGRWACNKRLWPYCQAAQDKVRQIRSEGRVVTLRHVRRCFNKEADSLSNVAMDRPEEEADPRLLLSESGGTAASTQSTTDGNAVLRPSMAPS